MLVNLFTLMKQLSCNITQMGGILARREAIAFITGGVLGLASCLAVSQWRNKPKRTTVMDVIGNTPMLYLPKLSKATGCTIYVTCLPLRPRRSS